MPINNCMVSIAAEKSLGIRTYRAKCDDRFREDVRRASPVLLEDPCRYLLHLCSEIRRKLSIRRRVMNISGGLGAFLVLAARKPRKFLLHRLEFLTLTPYSRPVNVGVGLWRCPNHLEHVLSWVRSRLVGWRSVTAEVVDQDMGVAADVAEIHSTPSLSQQ